MKIKLYGSTKSFVVGKDLVIPAEDIRYDIITRAWNKIHSTGRNPAGVKPGAGMQHVSATRGKGTGSSRVQRSKGLYYRAVNSPNNIGGRRAHPPQPLKNVAQKINKKENILAIKNALAVSLNKDLTYSRGSVRESFVIPEEVRAIDRTKEAQLFLEKVGFEKEISYVRKQSNVHRAGRGTYRGRIKKNPRSFLYVTSDPTEPFALALSNIKGVDVTLSTSLNVYDLAPGNNPGRILIFTQSAWEWCNNIYGGELDE